MSDFQQHANSLFASCLSESGIPHQHLVPYPIPPKEVVNSISLISALYLYTNPPPIGYGEPLPKIYESIQRAYEFNKKKKCRTEIWFLDHFIYTSKWDEDEDGPFIFNEVTGNWHPNEVFKMTQCFVSQYYPIIDQVTDQVVQEVLSRNSDVLTKGRQTWCPIVRKSVTSVQAYKNMSCFFYDNLGVESMTCLEWIQSFFKCMGLPSLKHKVPISILKKKRIYDKATNQFVLREYYVRKLKWARTKSVSESRALMIQYATTFCGYIKHGERSKLSRRAIASASMILRMFLYIIEEFHLNLSKLIEGATIAIGGDEKKCKITTALQSLSLSTADSKIGLQLTEDAKKWNECLSGEVFAVVHYIFFSAEARKLANLPPPTPSAHLLMSISVSGNFLLLNKSIYVGEGPIAVNEKVYNRLNWVDTPLSRFNERTREWVENMRTKLHPSFPQFVLAEPGMLMGMHNALSTTVGVIADSYQNKTFDRASVTLRSSDDSMTAMIAINSEELARGIFCRLKNLHLMGINCNMGKSLAFKLGYGEFTSWYQDGQFVAQFGVESTTLRPGGKNSHDDFYSIAKNTQASLTRLEINPLGAEARIRIGVDNVRRLYRIQYQPEKRLNVKSNVLLLSDGGKNPWDSSTCHLEETCLKEHFITTEEEKQYFLRIRNPDSPFHPPLEEEISYNPQIGSMSVITAEIPRNIFTFTKRSNRTIINKDPTFADSEKAHAELSNLIKMFDPTTLIKVPLSKVTVADQIKSIINIQMTRFNLTPDELIECFSASSRLEGHTNFEDEETQDIELPL